MTTENENSKEQAVTDSTPEQEEQEHEMTLEEFEERQKERLDLLRKTSLGMGIAFVVLVAIAIVVFAAGMMLTVNGVITPQFNFHMVIIALFTGLIAVTVLVSGLRPTRARLRDLEATLAEMDITDDYAAMEYALMQEDQLGRLEQERAKEEAKANGIVNNLATKTSSENIDDFYKIFERGIRNELVPPWEGYRRVLRIRNIVFFVSAIVLVLAIALYFLLPTLEVLSIVLLLLAYLGIVVGFYIDRSQLKPERKKFARMLNATEFEVRHQLYRDIEPDE